ncbi:MAG TPA: H(2)-dependent methylenetetrahydromethanopterin dehydrogenase-related protein [Methanothermococcus okinawensis]|uniref:H(2)-dependent methylenetetrahydromethanopterin dehydrogenase-related protein n=1 Tax=Methanothermococcus okinawensis TaxID=155863 RepID=A0A832YSX1_9EURY|nr:H(2)-dependent methylenetetrahydromethanopterin dehydrogenase-related protein [Methanothermococcus okinawensis]
MKISVYGAGNQNLYINKLNLPELYGGEPPYGGSRMAMEFAEAGHDVILSEPDGNKLTDEMWKKVEESGVKVTNNDMEAAKHGELHILFTPFGCHTVNIAKKIINYLPKNGVILTTCTASPSAIYSCLKYELRERKDVGISSMHPAAVPGTPQHDHYVIGDTPLDGKDYLTEEQLRKCVQLVESVNKKAYVVPIDVVPTVSDMGALVTAIALAGVLEYYIVGRRIINAPKKMIEQQIVMTLQTMSSIVETSGVYGLLKALNVELVTKSASSMHLLNEQKGLELALDILKNLDEKIIEKSKNAKINPTTLVASQTLVNEFKALIGDKAAEGAIERSMKTLFVK